MTHEFKEIIKSYQQAKQEGFIAVMATVVAIEGSSYRRPGVGMLLLEHGKMIGAVSGGCVEKEVWRQAQSVFASGTPKMMSYDGKYRLGCEGTLYILIEPFEMDMYEINTIQEYLEQRMSFEMVSSYTKKLEGSPGMGSVIRCKGQTFPFSKKIKEVKNDSLDHFNRQMLPCFKLLIFGTEHDAEQLCKLASTTGWEVEIISSVKDVKQLSDFPGAQKMMKSEPEDLQISTIDNQTAIILMSHNFAKDLLYLQALQGTKPSYIGLLGPSQRREKLLSALVEYAPDVTDDFLDIIHGPAGLNLGAETPQEIAISIIAEILSVIRNQEPIPLQDKKGAIHDTTKHIVNAVSVKTP